MLRRGMMTEKLLTEKWEDFCVINFLSVLQAAVEPTFLGIKSWCNDV